MNPSAKISNQIESMILFIVKTKFIYLTKCIVTRCDAIYSGCFCFMLTDLL